MKDTGRGRQLVIAGLCRFCVFLFTSTLSCRCCPCTPAGLLLHTTPTTPPPRFRSLHSPPQETTPRLHPLPTPSLQVRVRSLSAMGGRVPSWLQTPAALMAAAGPTPAVYSWGDQVVGDPEMGSVSGVGGGRVGAVGGGRWMRGGGCWAVGAGLCRQVPLLWLFV